MFDLHSDEQIKLKTGVQEHLFGCILNHSLYIEQNQNIFEIYNYWETFWLPFCVHKSVLASGPAPSEWRRDALNAATPNLADKPILADGLKTA